MKPEEWPLNEGGKLWTLGQQTLESVARHYHPKQDRPLLELTVPLVKVGGKSIAYKGAAEGELEAARGALHLLHAHAEIVPVSACYGERTLIVSVKDAPTPKAYPRRAGTPEKKPL